MISWDKTAWNWVRACLLACVCVRACVLTCLRACVRACVLTCLRACVLACLLACVRPCVRACLRACLECTMSDWANKWHLFIVYLLMASAPPIHFMSFLQVSFTLIFTRMTSISNLVTRLHQTASLPSPLHCLSHLSPQSTETTLVSASSLLTRKLKHWWITSNITWI